ncbi:hypothetical protein [Neobacillus soli]|uniref:hypothetical protein n=1 Tax=Neobacillus soli TaxID=220688 RepID=UPI00082436D7|nr:hypothetical protein [Neobacillus soli]
MVWIKIFGLILSIICLVAGPVQLYRFKKEVQKHDEGQVITDKLAKKWVKRLYWVIFWIILGVISSIAATILSYL